MKNTNKAFTLVELIVVITILAILATIAFISFQGSTADAKNVKVKSDVANLAKKISIVNAQGTNFVDLLVSNGNTSNEVTTLKIAGNQTITTGYDAGTVDFGKLQEDDAAFKDKAGNDYIYATAGTGSFSYYQVAGELVDANAAKTALIKGNYAQTDTVNDSASLIANAAGGTALASGDTSVLY